MPNPTDVENYSFKFSCYHPADNYRYESFPGHGEVGLQIARIIIADAVHEPGVTDCSIQYVPRLDVALWDYDETSLPADPENYTWMLLAETNYFTDDWVLYGQNIIDGIDGFDMLKPVIEPLQDYSSDNVRNFALGYTPLVTGWLTWESE